MADAYWRYAGDRQQSTPLPSQLAKRPRSDHEIPSGLGISSYYAREDERGGQHVVRDTDSINASYDRYLRSAQISHGGETGRSVSVGLGGLRQVDDPRTSPMGGSDPVVVANGLSMGLGGRSKIPLPPDASSTLFVEGLPANCTRREVAHIFRPFVGYKEVRLVNKGSRHTGGDPLVLCFVDFQSPAHAATAMDALKDYISLGRDISLEVEAYAAAFLLLLALRVVSYPSLKALMNEEFVLFVTKEIVLLDIHVYFVFSTWSYLL